MGGGPPCFTRDFTCPALLWYRLTPNPGLLRFGLFRFRSPLLTESILFLFLLVLRCFSSQGGPPGLMPSDGRVIPGRVSPFGYPRIEAPIRLPAAFRSIARPSSPASAKASTARPDFARRIAPPAPDSAVLCSLQRALPSPGGALLANNLNCLCSAKVSLDSPPLDRKIFRNASRGFQGPSGETRTLAGSIPRSSAELLSTQMTFRARFELSSPIPAR